MKILFTICGRAGSQGCPKKNERLFYGMPLAYYALSLIDLYQQAHPEHEIQTVLNTDSLKLQELIAQQSKVLVEVLSRREDLADGIVPKIAVIKDCLHQVNDTDVDMVIDLDLTAPFRRLADLERIIRKYTNSPDFDIVFSTSESRRNPYFNMVIEEDGYAQLAIPEGKFHYTSRQQTPEMYDVNGAIYVYSPTFLRQNTSNRLFDARCSIIHMPDTGILDIDSEQDFELMQVIAAYLFEKDPDLAAVRDHFINAI